MWYRQAKVVVLDEGFTSRVGEKLVGMICVLEVVLIGLVGG